MAKFREIMDRINCKLEQAGQLSRIVEYARSSAVFNNGSQLLGKEWQQFKSRLLSPFSDLWLKNCDKLLTGEISVADIKKEFARLRGKKCQEIHGEKIKLNLNTGVPWSKGKPGSFRGRTHSDEAKQSISVKNTGANNGMFGRHLSDDQKLNKSKIMKELILSGQFTPNSNNKNTHWETMYNGVKYRSSWEALYHHHNPAAKYEVLRILYEWQGKEKIYIVDFIDMESKLVVEVKPKELCRNEKFKVKWNALQKWATDNGYKALLVDKEWFIANTSCPDLGIFDTKTARKIGQIYEIGKKNPNR